MHCDICIADRFFQKEVSVCSKRAVKSLRYSEKQTAHFKCICALSTLSAASDECYRGFEMASMCSMGRGTGEGGALRRRNGLYVGGGSRLSLGDCWISGTQISPTCEPGCNEKMGRGVDVGWERM